MARLRHFTPFTPLRRHSHARCAYAADILRRYVSLLPTALRDTPLCFLCYAFFAATFDALFFDAR